MWKEKQDNILVPADRNGPSRKRKVTAMDYSPVATSEYHSPWNSCPLEAGSQSEPSRHGNNNYNNHNNSNTKFYPNQAKLEKPVYFRPQFDYNGRGYLNQSNLGHRSDNGHRHLSKHPSKTWSMSNASYSLPPQHSGFHPLLEMPAGQPFAVPSQQSQPGYAFARSESHVNFPSPTSNSSLVEKPHVGPHSYDLVNLSNMNNTISLSSLDFARPSEFFQQNIIVQTNRVTEGQNETTGIKEENEVESIGILENGQQSNVVRDTKIVDSDIKSQPTLLTGDKIAESQTNEKRKSPCGKTVFSVVSEKLWDGSLQLNYSVTVAAVAFFKSGDKLLDTNWSEIVVVKGKVRLEAFEKYIQELSRSRSRGLMVVSLYWKEGSSDSGLTGMKEVSNAYLMGQKVGFANLSTGIDIYICPRSDKIITILAKYGFFKGMAAIEDNHDSMIGCVVWKRNKPSSKSDPKEMETKNTVLSDQNQTVENETTKHNEKKNKEPGESQNNVNTFILLSQECLDAKKPESCLKNQKTVVNEVEKALTNSDDDDLPEYDFGKAGGFSLVLEDKSAEAFVEQTMLQAIHARGINVSQNLEHDKYSGKISTNVYERKRNMYESTKIVFFDDDDMPEWCPPAVAVPSKGPTFQNMSPGPPRAPLHSPLIRVPIPVPSSRQDPFSYQTFSNAPMINSVPTPQNGLRSSVGPTSDHVMRPDFNGRQGRRP